MSPATYTCEWCGERLEPTDRVVESAVDEHGGTAPGERFLYHERHWDPAYGRETYRGALAGLRLARSWLRSHGAR